MLLYDSAGPPSPRRARMLLAEKGVTIEQCQIDMRQAEHLTPEFLAINPRATLPVLITDGGTPLTENIAIAAYIEEMYPKPPMMGNDAEEKAAVMMWNAICEHQGFTAAAETLRNSENYKPDRAITGPVDFARIPELAERGRQRVDLYFNQLEQRLTASPYLASSQFTLADITGFIVCEFMLMIKIPIPDSHSMTHAWFNAIKSRPSANA